MRDQNPAPLILPEAQKDEAIGIPNVPAMIWQAEQERSRELLSQGLCPIHHTELVEKGVDEGAWEECPICSEQEY